MSNTQMNAAYLNAVCGWAGIDNSQSNNNGGESTRVVFPCIQDTRSILAGSGVPNAITNRELAEKADALLNSAELWYNPGSKGKYSDYLSRYLDYVIFKDGDKAAQNLIDEKIKRVATAGGEYRAIKESANKAFKTTEETDKGTFKEWAPLNYPELSAAEDSVKAANTELAQARVASGVPQARQLNKYKEQFKLMEGVDAEVKAGLTMPCAAGQVFDIKNWVERLRRDGHTSRPDEPTDIWVSPLFTLDSNYASEMDNYYKDFDKLENKVRAKLETNIGTEDSAKKAGREVTQVQGSFSIGWLRFSASHNETKEWSDSSATRKDTSSTVTIFCKAKFPVSVTPGNKWDVPGFRKLFPYTREGTPEAVKNLVRPTQLLCAVGLGYTVQIDEKVRNDFDTEYKKAKGSNGQLSIFGLNVDVNYAPENTSESTHKSNWDAKTGTLTIEPANIVGCFTMLAVIGDKGEI